LQFSGGIGDVAAGVHGQQMTARPLFVKSLSPWVMFDPASGGAPGLFPATG
jgi:hypothetical protein